MAPFFVLQEDVGFWNLENAYDFHNSNSNIQKFIYDN
jgi:hypothetical protein